MNERISQTTAINKQMIELSMNLTQVMASSQYESASESESEGLFTMQKIQKYSLCTIDIQLFSLSYPILTNFSFCSL
jgi:hypothetical protein